MKVGVRVFGVGAFSAEVSIGIPGYVDRVKIVDGPGPMNANGFPSDGEVMVVDVPGTGPGTFQQASITTDGTIRRIVGSSIVEVPVRIDVTAKETRRGTPTNNAMVVTSWVVTEISNGVKLMERTAPEGSGIVEK